MGEGEGEALMIIRANTRRTVTGHLDIKCRRCHLCSLACV